MEATERNGKAIIHVSGTLLRRAWWGKELNSCIVVRPSGEERDTTGYIVNQVRFTGPSALIFSAKPREKPHDPRDNCEPSQGETKSSRKLRETHPTQGFVGTLSGFDNAILVYLEADESVIQIQPSHGDAFIPFAVFKEGVAKHRIPVPVVNPRLEMNC